jgi:hypothetical protein
MIAGCISSGGAAKPQVLVETAVVSQPTADRAPTVEFTLTNEGGGEIIASANSNEPFVIVPRLDGTDASVVLLPSVRKVTSDVAESRTDGCWRFVTPDGDDAKFVYEDDVDRLSLGSGLSHTVQHRLFYDGDENDCFPDGNYTTVHRVRFHETESTIAFTVRLTFSDGQISTLDVQRQIR